MAIPGCARLVDERCVTAPSRISRWWCPPVPESMGTHHLAQWRTANPPAAVRAGQEVELIEVRAVADEHAVVAEGLDVEPGDGHSLPGRRDRLAVRKHQRAGVRAPEDPLVDRGVADVVSSHGLERRVGKGIEEPCTYSRTWSRPLSSPASGTTNSTSGRMDPTNPSTSWALYASPSASAASRGVVISLSLLCADRMSAVERRVDEEGGWNISHMGYLAGAGESEFPFGRDHGELGPGRDAQLGEDVASALSRCSGTRRDAPRSAGS